MNKFYETNIKNQFSAYRTRRDLSLQYFDTATIGRGELFTFEFDRHLSE